MFVDKLTKVKLHDLKNLYSAEKQLFEQLPSLAKMASDGLERELQGHIRATQTHLRCMEEHFEDSEYNLEGHRCRRMEGLLEEIREVAEVEEGFSRNALLVTGLQRAQHYLIAGYGLARAFGNWKQLKARIKEQWGKLTDYDLDQVEGRADQLAGKLEERYGYERAQAERKVESFFDALSS